MQKTRWFANTHNTLNVMSAVLNNLNIVLEEYFLMKRIPFNCEISYT